MAIRETPNEFDHEETEEQFEARIKGTPVGPPDKRRSRLTEEPLLGTDEDDDEVLPAVPDESDILAEESLDDENDTA